MNSSTFKLIPIHISILVLVCFSPLTYSYNTQNSLAVLSTNCLSDQWNKIKLLKLKENNFEIKEDETRYQLAIQLLNCLASPDPVLRDGIAFEALSSWMRNKQLNNKFHKVIFEKLYAALNKKENDPEGVYLPFVSLVLAEVARVDRIEPFLGKLQREQLVKAAVNYLVELRDYRGFDETIGWRHGIAHTADLFLQLALNPQLEKPLLDKILNAIANQISAKNNHFYIYGEPQRLAMPLIYVLLTGKYSVDEWEDWLAKISLASPLKSWNDAYKSQYGLAKLHNTRNFLNSLYTNIKNSKNENLIDKIPALEKAIQTVR
jgi:hypothetical protein